jgi:microcin C transport system permease protein
VLAYTLRRLLLMIPTLLGIMVVNFVIVQAAPGGPVELMIVEDGNHIATNRAYRWRSQSADWMQEKLG